TARGADQVLQVILAKLASDGRAVDRQHPAVIRLNQYTDCVNAKALWDHARRRADAAFPSEGHSAGSCADRAFLDRPVIGGSHCGEDIFSTGMAPSNAFKRADDSLGN